MSCTLFGRWFSAITFFSLWLGSAGLSAAGQTTLIEPTSVGTHAVNAAGDSPIKLTRIGIDDSTDGPNHLVLQGVRWAAGIDSLPKTSPATVGNQ